jgi:glycogen synthase
MRILISTDTVGGVWDHTVALAAALQERGHSVLLAVLGEARDSRLAALPDGVEVTWRPYRLEWMLVEESEIVDAGNWLRDTAKLWQADLVHLNQMAYAAAGFAMPTLVVVHSDVLSWHSEAQGREAPREEWLRYRRWVGAGLGAADVVAAPTSYQAELVHRHYGIPGVRVVHNGIPVPQGRRVRAEHPLVLSVGRAWDAAKGMRVLDDAVGRLGSAAPPAHLLGETRGPHGQAFGPRHLTAHGRVERAVVDEWFDRASVYVAASLYEPFGLAPAEAALRGCALVLSDIASFRELWDGCARFFPRGDAAALAETIAELAADGETSAALAQAARTRAMRRYTTKHMAAAYLELYESMLAVVAGRIATV